MVWIKICGITSNFDLEIASRAGADALGFIVDVSVKTPRKITAESAKKMIAGVKDSIETVAVVTPASTSEALRIAELLKPDYLQIHSDLEPEEIKKIRKSADARVIKTIEVNGASNTLTKMELYENSVDAVLLDSAKKGEKGSAHDWEISCRIVRECSVPVILAGGLNPENVAEAISAVKPHGVDVASGVELEGKAGRKDPEKLKKFIERARQHGTF